MDVCFLAGTLGLGGAEKQLLYMIRALKTAGIETRVLSLTSGEEYERRIRDLGIEIEWVGPFENKITRLMRIVDSLRKRPASILQSAHFFTNLYVAAAGRVLGGKTVGAIRGDLISEFKLNGFYAKWQLVSPHHLITNSEQALKRALSKGIKENAIDLVKNVVIAETKGDVQDTNKNKDLNIVFVGRLDKNKRPGSFVDLAYHILRDRPDLSVRFQMVGDGPLRPELEDRVRDLGLSESKFSFTGIVEDMSGIYREADGVILTSEHEGTPNVLLEAMAYGVPVVATRVGGIPEILSEKCGILVDPYNPQELIEATSKLISDQSFRRELGIQGQKYVEANHSIGYLQHKMTEIYSKL